MDAEYTGSHAWSGCFARQAAAQRITAFKVLIPFFGY
jgi:hypothetical protein